MISIYDKTIKALHSARTCFHELTQRPGTGDDAAAIRTLATGLMHLTDSFLDLQVAAKMHAETERARLKE